MNNSNYEMVSIRNSLYENKLLTIAFETGVNLDDFLEKYVYQLNLNNHEKLKDEDRIDKLRGRKYSSIYQYGDRVFISKKVE